MGNSLIRKCAIKHYINGVYTHTSYIYRASIPEENLPNCPNCRDFPLQNDCAMVAHDDVIGNQDVQITIQRQRDNQSLFEKFYTVYNIAQAGLNYLQQYPEFGAAIYEIQQLMMGIDIAGLLATAYYLQKQIQEKLQIQKRSSAKAWYRLAAIATFVAVCALSYLAVLQINAYLQSAFVLKEILAQLAISPEVLKTVDVQWASAAMMQSLYLTRLIMSVSLGFFSKHRWLSMWNAVAQAFSFTAISRLKWIEMSQTLTDYPLKKIFAEGGTHRLSLNELSLSDLTVKSEFLVDPSCTKEAHHLKSTLKSIYDYMSKLLDKSHWDRYWKVTYTNGIESSRKIFYSVQLQSNLVPPCDCTLVPSLTGLLMSGRDAQYGLAAFDVYR